MDVDHTLILDLGWIFFAAWGMILAAFTLIAFGGDLLPSRSRSASHPERN
jgi:hypothetical protein